MKTTNAKNWIIDSYFRIIQTLQPANRRDLISRLTLSAKSESNDKSIALWESFGGWDPDETAEEIINSIKNSRYFNRNLETL
jgi:hypothetical protein